MNFDSMRNGYNRYQVDDEFSKLNEKIEKLERQVAAYQKQSEQEKKKYDNLMLKYQELLRDIDIREQAAKDMTSIALNEANEIVTSANNNAEVIIKEALFGARNILVSISKLGIEAQEVKLNLNEQLKLLSAAIEEFDVPPIPDPELISKYEE